MGFLVKHTSGSSINICSFLEMLKSIWNIIPIVINCLTKIKFYAKKIYYK